MEGSLTTNINILSSPTPVVKAKLTLKGRLVLPFLTLGGVIRLLQFSFLYLNSFVVFNLFCRFYYISLSLLLPLCLTKTDASSTVMHCAAISSRQSDAIFAIIKRCWQQVRHTLFYIHGGA